ncbi:hypothetical protein HanXRQr2_Chr04g0173541 [Helianthus annuus]|uniref:Putative AWPM-19-like protein n=1 Tax=Helianthus annuus TaxID=4232 RepID=A0A251UZY3_HELAN|nr:hypothetical protein HanXRQr2_Chr04g0173541 [Helianthus annuus]KAJ0581531.1 hypothetical protein HanHA300_Chr04g0142101 [Helianthus annuus]KAJ0589517.1 hypothetical protein HanIR_Chr04g0187141 [Helianthus annuus]KAJ0597494.1 hypothetical protein HanHA89_Chr04g0155251 [Helianthus annuus]KAJ0758142.1 hypothetical protein HanLR1_Chr04g0146981 [Helianthus annuus]
MGNWATRFFVTFTLIVGVVGIASILVGFDYYRALESPSKFAWKEIELEGRNVRLRTMEAFTIILSVTQLVYVAALYGIDAVTSRDNRSCL